MNDFLVFRGGGVPHVREAVLSVEQENTLVLSTRRNPHGQFPKASVLDRCELEGFEEHLASVLLLVRLRPSRSPLKQFLPMSFLYGLSAATNRFQGCK